MAFILYRICHFLLIFASLLKITGQIDMNNAKRDRSHIDVNLKLDSQGSIVHTVREKKLNAILDQLNATYHRSIKPMEDKSKFKEMGKHPVTDADIKMKPTVLFVGPWSTGKSTMINYLLGIEDAKFKLITGAHPTTTEFTVLMHGEKEKNIEGMVLAADSKRSFSTLEKFGQGFLKKLKGIEMPNRLLEKVIIVDTPGILENRKQQDRGYPFKEVLQWFITHADMIFVVFDPTKLDVGTELEVLFTLLKGQESQIKLILNKADAIPFPQLMRVYGTLFWNLAPLIKIAEPPRVYMGSFWSEPWRNGPQNDMFKDEEINLLNDLNDMFENKLEKKIAHIRQYAAEVRQHALIVNQYSDVFNKHKNLFSKSEKVANHIIHNPGMYRIFETVSVLDKVSNYDLPKPCVYEKFFSIHAIDSFQKHCSFFSGWFSGGCLSLDELSKAINTELPELLNRVKEANIEQCSADENCK